MPEFLAAGGTLVCEAVYAGNDHVVAYETDTLYLLAGQFQTVRCRTWPHKRAAVSTSGREMSWSALQSLGQELQLELPAVFSGQALEFLDNAGGSSVTTTLQEPNQLVHLAAEQVALCRQEGVYNAGWRRRLMIAGAALRSLCRGDPTYLEDR